MIAARIRPLLWTACLAGAIPAGASYWLAGPARFWANWILWFLFLATLALGCLFLVALEHLVGARWSVPIRRVPERLATLLLPVTPVALFALGAVPALYPGARLEAVQDPVLAGKAAWLGLPLFSLRTGASLALALLVLFVLVRGSLRQDRGDPGFTPRARRFAPVAMALFAVVITVMAFDWISGLTPDWYSDIFGVYLFAGSFLAGLAASTLAVLHLQRRGRLGQVRRDHLYNLGGFLFAFTVFWSYIAFSQYLLMWYGNLPGEVVWYRARFQGGWHRATVALALLHFVLPFFALVTRAAKSDPGRLLRVGLLILGAHLLDLYWLVFPALGAGVLCGWPEWSFALCCVAGALLWVDRSFGWGEDMPVGDPFLGQGLEFRL
jgi:hypothetical protein